MCNFTVQISISYFALDTEKSYFFSESGKSVISYVLEGSTAVVAGDPIGPENEMDLILKQFMAFCTEQDWTIVLWQVRDKFVPLYRAAGLHLFKIGEDAVIDVQISRSKVVQWQMCAAVPSVLRRMVYRWCFTRVR